MVIKLILAGVVGYLIGSISWAVIMSRIFAKEDVRERGSGNAGATNVARVYGLGPGALTFLADFAKTCASMLLGRLIAGDMGYLLAGASCIVGHCWPVFFGFVGGKGVSVGASIGLMLDWRLFLCLVLVFGIMALLFRRASVASISCGVSFPIIQLVLGMRGWELALGIFAGALVVFMHRSNIVRLIKGEEPKFKAKSAK